jgi:arsenate reductase
MKRKVLFICNENSCRSQMAEGLLRTLGGERFEAYSAGTDPGAVVNPVAVAVMSELGIDIARQQPKPVRPFLGRPVNYAITVCDPVVERCPIFPGMVQRLTWTFPDPGKAEGTPQEQLAMFRRVRDDIAAQIRRFLEDIPFGDVLSVRARFTARPR